MAFTGYSTITEPRYPVTHRLTQRIDELRSPPIALFGGQDFSDLHHALLKPADTPALSYACSDVADGYLLIQSGADGVVFDADGRIVKESAIWADRAVEQIGIDELKARARPLDHAIFVGIDPGWWTYYHWFVISLGRMGLYFSAFDDGTPIALAPYRDDGRMRFGADVRSDTLALMGPPERFLTLSDGIYHAPRIRFAWIESPQQAFVCYFHAFRSAMERLRASLTLSDTAPRDRIILLRDYDQRLAGPAQQALQDLVDRHGFSVARPERLGFADQARLFANAACVIAPHGAGLCNILFGDPSLRVFELNTEYDGPYVRPWFYLLAAIRNQPYAYLNQTRSQLDAAEIREMALAFAGDL